VACLSTKATISLKRVKMEEKLLWGANRNPPMFFRMVPSPTLYGLPLPRIGGSQPPPRTSIATISETGKATGFKFGRYIHRAHPSKSPLKGLKKGVWAYLGTAEIFWDTPYYLRNGYSYRLQIWQIHSQDPSEQKPVKSIEKRKHGRIQELSNFGGYPLLSQRRVKLRTSNFVRTFIGANHSIGTKFH